MVNNKFYGLYIVSNIQMELKFQNFCKLIIMIFMLKKESKMTNNNIVVLELKKIQQILKKI